MFSKMRTYKFMFKFFSTNYKSNRVIIKNRNLKINKNNSNHINNTFINNSNNKIQFNNDKEIPILKFSSNNLIIRNDKIYLINKNSEYKTIVEMRDDMFALLKLSRILSFYISIPYNILLIIFSLEIYTLDIFISHCLNAFSMIICPYILSENFVIEIKYDDIKNQLYITKLNFYCQLVTEVHDVSDLVRVSRKYSIRPFAYFKNKRTNEFFSILKICKINNPDLLDQTIPEKLIKKRVKSDETKGELSSGNIRLIDAKMNKNIITLEMVKIILLSYLIGTVISIYFITKNHKRMKRIDTEEEKI